MFSKIALILTICLLGTSLCVPISNEENTKETGKPFRYNENDQRQLDTAVSALLGSLLPQLQSTLSTAIQGAATNILGNFSIWDILRDNGRGYLPSEYLEDSPAFDSYVVNLPNVGQFVMLATNKPNDYDNSYKKPIILNKPIGLEQTSSGYYKPSVPLPYKPIVDSGDDIEYEKPGYVHEYKPIKKPYHHQIGSAVTLASHDDDKHEILKNFFNFDKKKATFSEQFSILQHKFHEQKEKIVSETINNINKLQAQLLGQVNNEYHHHNTPSPQYHNEYEAPQIIKKPINKPLGHYVGYQSTNVQRDANFE